jgi:cytochrome b subunit of formate dehydrogenase
MAAGNLTQADRFVISVLLVTMVILGITGVVMLYGSWLPWLFDLHRAAGFSLIILLPFKAATIYRSIRGGMGKTLDRSAVLISSLILAVLILIIIASGLMWMWRLGPYSSLRQTLLAWHWILAVLTSPLLILHIWRRWPRPQKNDLLTRRSALKLIALAGASFMFSWLATLLAEAQSTQDRPRRFTGSRGFGSYSGNAFPSTGEATVVLDAGSWQLAIDGAVRSPLAFTYPELLAMQQKTLTEAIDCHNGWFSMQDWQGIPLNSLLERAGAKQNVSGVRLVSATGLSNTHPIEEAREILLATHVSGEVLAPSHGYPLRAVIPGRRGWFWLKWLTKIEVMEGPLEMAGGILCTPLQVFRELNHPRISTDVQ